MICALRSEYGIDGKKQIGLSSLLMKLILLASVLKCFPNYRSAIFGIAALLGTAVLTSSAAQATTWVLERADTPDEVSEAQAAEWETKAREGDWQLKMEFAAAYLYDTFYPNYGCKALKYGHRCRAMAKRPEAGRVFLREVIDTEPKSHIDKVIIGSFQKYYAASLRHPAFILELGSEACRDKVHYYELALKNGEYCVGATLQTMAFFGTCMEKSEERAKAYKNQMPPLIGCPKY